MEDKYLSHHGVKGMKWGKRKSLPTSSIRSNLNSTKAQYKSARKAYKQAKTERKNALNKTYKEINKMTSFIQ